MKNKIKIKNKNKNKNKTKLKLKIFLFFLMFLIYHEWVVDLESYWLQHNNNANDYLGKYKYEQSVTIIDMFVLLNLTFKSFYWLFDII